MSEFESYLDHVAGVMLQTLSIEKSTLPDGATHEMTMTEKSPRGGKAKCWTLKFSKEKGTWKLVQVAHAKG